jgi:hypothetical protein
MRFLLQCAVTGKIDEPPLFYISSVVQATGLNAASKLSREDCGMIQKIFHNIHPNLMARQENQWSGIQITYAIFKM